MLLLALSFAVLDLTGSVTDVGLVLAASRAPLVLTVLAGGVVADRVSRQWLMVVADVVRAGALARDRGAADRRDRRRSGSSSSSRR